MTTSVSLSLLSNHFFLLVKHILKHGMRRDHFGALFLQKLG